MLRAAKVSINFLFVDATLADNASIPVFANVMFLGCYLVPAIAAEQEAGARSNVFANLASLWWGAAH